MAINTLMPKFTVVKKEYGPFIVYWCDAPEDDSWVHAETDNTVRVTGYDWHNCAAKHFMVVADEKGSPLKAEQIELAIGERKVIELGWIFFVSEGTVRLPPDRIKPAPAIVISVPGGLHDAVPELRHIEITALTPVKGTLVRKK